MNVIYPYTNPDVQARWAAAIPRFYFPGGRPVSDEVLAAAAARVDALLNVYSGGLTIPGMKQLVKEVRCGAWAGALPSSW